MHLLFFPEMNGVEPWASGEVDTAWAVAANTAYPEDAKQTVEFLGMWKRLRNMQNRIKLHA